MTMLSDVTADFPEEISCRLRLRRDLHRLFGSCTRVVHLLGDVERTGHNPAIGRGSFDQPRLKVRHRLVASAHIAAEAAM